MADRKRTDMDWEDLRVFLALARSGTLSATARALRVNHATVARRITALELAAGYALFERRADGYRLTQHGRAILDQATVMETAAGAIGDALALPSGPQGHVRLTTVRSIADLVLSPHIHTMLAAYPGLQLEIITSTRVRSLAQRDADIALRLGRPGNSDLKGRRIATIRYGFYGSALRKQDWQEGRIVPLIAYDAGNDRVAEALWLSKTFPDHPVALRADSSFSQAQAAANGAGIALLPRYVANAVSGLVEIDFAPVFPDRDLWMLTPPSLADVPRVRTVCDSLAAIFDQQRAMF